MKISWSLIGGITGLRSIMNYGILLGVIVILLAPHVVQAEATHSGEFDRPLDDAFRIYSNVSSFPQTVMVTVCVDGTSADILVGGEAILSIGTHSCAGGTLRVLNGQGIVIRPLIPATVKGTFQVSVSLARLPLPGD